MRFLKLYIILILFLSFSKAYSINNIENIQDSECYFIESKGPSYLGINYGKQFNAFNDLNLQNLIGSESTLRKNTFSNLYLGISFSTFANKKIRISWDKIGFDLSYGHSTITNEGAFRNLNGINNTKDTINLVNFFNSNFEIQSLVFSPFYSYSFNNSYYYITIKPQFSYNFISELNTSINLHDTNFVSFLGKPEIIRNSKGIVTNFQRKNIRKLDFNTNVSIDYEIHTKTNYSIILSLNFTIGTSPIDNKLFANPGFNIRISKGENWF